MEKLGSNKIQVLLWGFGFTNKLIMRYLLEKNYTIAGVITRSNIGEDPYKIADLEEYKIGNKEIKISSYLNAEETLKEMSSLPNVCILSTKSDLKDIYDELKILAKYKINVVTIAEEMFYPYESSPKLIDEIDKLFKENNVSLVGTGFQDYFSGFISASLINSCHKVEKIIVHTKYNSDLFGDIDGINKYGKSKEFYNEKFKNGPKPINFQISLWLAAMFNWKIVDISFIYKPLLLELDEFNSNLYGTILKDHVVGEISEVTVKCENGAIIVHILEGVLFHSELDKEMISWKIEGEPSLNLVLNDPCTPEITCASTVNRIMNVINSKEKGYIPTFKFGFH